MKDLKEPDDAANQMVDAFKVYRTESPQDAARCLEFAIDRYCAKGNFRRAAGYKESLGEVYEQQLGDTKAALDAYETAAGWYEGDNATAYVYSSQKPGYKVKNDLTLGLDSQTSST